MELIEIIMIVLLLLGAVLHGVTGLGFPMISTMSVAILFPLPLAVALVVLPNVFINIMVLLPSKQSPDTFGVGFYVKKYWLLVASSFIGCLIGVMLLKRLSLSWLYLFLASATLFYIFYTLFGQGKSAATHLSVENSTGKQLILGALAGVVGGATNAMSSILMMYLLAASDNKNEIVKTSNFCFLLAKIVQILLLKDQLLHLDARALWALPIVTLLSVLALWGGMTIRHSISVVFFKRCVLAMLAVLSLRALWQAFAL